MLQADVDLNKLLALSYVYVSRDRVHPRNVFGGFLPFILAVADPTPGKRFEPSQISTRLRESFGWPVSGDFVSLYLEDFLRNGLIERGEGPGYIWTDKAVPPNEDKGRETLEALAGAFFQFSTELAGPMLQNRNAEERLHDLANALVSNRLFSEDALETFAGREDANADENLGMDYVCARFVKHCYRHDEGSYHALVTLSQLGIICQLATFFARPPSTEKTTSKLLVALDGPFLVDLMGFSGESRRTDAALTIKLARERKAKIVLFAHCLDEAHDVVKGVLNNEPNERFGPTAAAMREGSVSGAILDAFVQTPRQIVEGTKLIDEIIPHDDKRVRGNSDAFNQDDWDALFGALVGWKELAARRDCNSVRNVMRLRGETVSTNVWQSRVILLTSNVHLARIAKHVCVSHGLIGEDMVGPVVSRFQLAALLWLAGGHNEKLEIASAQLLSAASALLTRDRGLIRSVQEYASGIEGQQRELVQAFTGNSLSYEFLQDATLGGTRPVDEQSVDLVLHRLVEHGRAEGAEEERKATASRVQSERDAKADAERRAQGAIEAAEVAENRAAAAQQAAQAAERSATSQAEKARKEMARVDRVAAQFRTLLSGREETWQRHHRTAAGLSKALRWAAVVGLCALISLLSLTAVDAGVALGVAVATFAALCGLMTTHLFDRGREIERQVADRITKKLLEDPVQTLNNELGPAAPAVEVQIDHAGIRISNKEQIVSALVQ